MVRGNSALSLIRLCSHSMNLGYNSFSYIEAINDIYKFYYKRMGIKGVFATADLDAYFSKPYILLSYLISLSLFLLS